MQRGWHPTGKVLGNVVGGIVDKLRGENMMQNGPGGEEKRQDGPCAGSIEPQCVQFHEQRDQTNEMQNGGEAEEERRSNINEMQNGGEAEEERRSNINEMQNGEEVEEERRKMCMYGPDGTPDETLCQ